MEILMLTGILFTDNPKVIPLKTSRFYERKPRKMFWSMSRKRDCSGWIFPFREPSLARWPNSPIR